MNNYFKISDSENEVMEIIWSHDNWIGVSEVIDKLPDSKKRAYNTVTTFIASLQ